MAKKGVNLRELSEMDYDKQLNYLSQAIKADLTTALQMLSMVYHEPEVIEVITKVFQKKLTEKQTEKVNG